MDKYNKLEGSLPSIKQPSRMIIKQHNRNNIWEIYYQLLSILTHNEYVSSGTYVCKTILGSCGLRKRVFSI